MYNLVTAVGKTTDVDSTVLGVGLTVVTEEQNTFLHDFTHRFFQAKGLLMYIHFALDRNLHLHTWWDTESSPYPVDLWQF